MYTGLGLTLGSALGVTLWVLTDQVAFLGLGVGIGLPIGVAIDAMAPRDGGGEDSTDQD